MRPTWGDTVRVKDHVPAAMRPGQLAAVCGLREAETAEEARQFGCAIGATLYLVEFRDGNSSEIPETLLEAVNDAAEPPGG